MSRILAAITAVMLFIGSLRAADAPPPATAAAPTTAPAQGLVVAQVGPASVTLPQLEKPLIEGYGLNVLLNLLQLELARQQTAKAGLVVTPADIQHERDWTIENMFKESNEKQLDKLNDYLSKNMTAEAEKVRAEIKHDNDQAFEQFLANQHISRAEFDIVTETNAHLRKLAEPMLAGKISDDNLKEAFNALYGETIKCRHIQLSNMAEVQEAKRRLASGEPFAKVAYEMSRNASTRAMGGELPAFSRQMQGLPQLFKDVAFALKEGEISEPVHVESNYHLILLEKRIAPKAVKFEDVKESLRQDLQKRALEAAVKEFRQQLAEQSVTGLQINDPVLKKQWEDRLSKRKTELKNKEEMRQQMERERGRSVTQPATMP